MREMAVRVGLLQMNCSRTRERNLARAEELVREAADKKAHVVPERLWAMRSGGAGAVV
jgi:hypothetical protein